MIERVSSYSLKVDGEIIFVSGKSFNIYDVPPHRVAAVKEFLATEGEEK